MLNLDKKLRDEIVRILPTLLVPASAGNVLMQIVNLLTELKEVEIPKKNVKDTPIQ